MSKAFVVIIYIEKHDVKLCGFFHIRLDIA